MYNNKRRVDNNRNNNYDRNNSNYNKKEDAIWTIK